MMCGIFGCISKECNAYREVIGGLKNLQYRGYDSSGIMYYDNGYKIEKTVGTIEKIDNPDIVSNLAFGHTRWATNGEVNTTNAHPHKSFDGRYIIVHNGIIENAKELEKELLKHNIVQKSKTDTEIFVNYLTLCDDIKQGLIEVYDKIKGSYAIILQDTKTNTVYVAKKFNSINVLKTANSIYISSDLTSLKEGELFELKDRDVVEIKGNTIKNINGKLEFHHHKPVISDYNLGEYQHYMIKEIMETPDSIRKTYESIKEIDFKSLFSKYKKLTFLGCGTAFHSGLIGKSLLKECGFECDSCLASDYELKHKIKANHLHILISQSGETADCIKIAQDILKNKGKILLVTNQPQSTLARMSNYVLSTNANKEIAVASTKTYCCQVFVFAYICEKLKNDSFDFKIDKFVYDLKGYIACLDVNKYVDEIGNRDKLILLAFGKDFDTILEASLKIREIDYIFTLPMTAGELKHGTLSLVDENALVIYLDTTNSRFLHNAINEIQSRKGKTVQIETKITNDSFQAIYSIIPFQLVSYFVARKRNINPDMPRNLAKSVTVH